MSNTLQGRLLSFAKGDGLRAQLVRGAMGVGGLKLLSMPLTLAASILLARGLGPEGYGQYVFVMSVIALLALPIGPGLGQLIIREVAWCQHGGEWPLFRGLLRWAHQWVAFGSALMIGGIAIIAAMNAAWAADDRWTLLLIASLTLPLMGFNALRSSTLRGLRHVFHAQLPDLLARPGFHLLFAGVLFAIGILNSATALVSQLVATALAFLMGAWILRRNWPQLVKEAEPAYRYGEWARALLPFTLLTAVSTLNGQFGILALGWLGTDKGVAALQLAQMGAMLVAFPLAIVNLVIGPYITQAYRDGNRVVLQELSRQSARAALAVSLPICLPLVFFGESVLGLVYGDAYAKSAAWPLAVLALSQMINVAFGSVGLFLTMSGFERETLVGQVLALIVNAALAAILIPLMGVDGAALAIAAGLVTWNSILSIQIMRRIKIRPSIL